MDPATHRDLLNANLGVVTLRLQLELNVQRHNLGVLEALGLLFESSVTEGLLERDSLDEQAVLHASSGHLLDSDERLVEVGLVQSEHGVDDHLGEEGLLRVDQLGREGSRGALEEQVVELAAEGSDTGSAWRSVTLATAQHSRLVGTFNGDGNLLDTSDGLRWKERTRTRRKSQPHAERCRIAGWQ